MAYTITWEKRGVYVKFVGTENGAESIEELEKLQSNPAFDDIRYNIIDHSEVAEFSITRDELEILAALRIGGYKANPYLKIAHVTDNKKIIEHFKLWASVGNFPNPPLIFPTLTQAREWAQQL